MAKKLYQEPGERITYISVAGEYLSLGQEIEDLLQELKNKEINIYVLDMSSACAKKRNGELRNYNLINSIKETVSSFKRAVKNFSGADYKQFRLYKYDNVPYLSGVILEMTGGDVEYYITHHLFYINTRNCLSFKVVRSNKAYNTYKKMFSEFTEKNKENLILDNKGTFNMKILQEWGIEPEQSKG